MDTERRLSDFAKARVLVVGDTIVDIYTYGSVLGISAETPTIVARQKSVTKTLGGAAFVCRNLLELGAHVDFITLVGRDDEARTVRDYSSDRFNLIAIEDPGRPTTVKHRFWVDGYKLFQLDVRDDSLIGDAVAVKVRAAVEKHLAKADALLISDYRHGLIGPAMARFLVEAAKAAGKPVYVDSQVAQNVSNHTDYRSGAIICVNLKEARCIDASFTPSADPAAFEGLQRALDAKALIVKLGEDGALAFDGRKVFQAPAWPVKVVDTIGAGDAFLATLVLAGLNEPREALALANAWAGLSIQKHGTATPSKDELIALLATSAAEKLTCPTD
jgi:rfaE bifunctional protein kinase chain/domain